MPYTLTWEPGGVYRRYHGDVSIAERRRSLDQIASDWRFDGLRYSITDFLDVAAYETSAEASAELAALHIGPMLTNRRLVLAAVVQRDDLLAAVRRFQAQGVVQAPYRIFGTLAEARGWIAGLGC